MRSTKNTKKHIYVDFYQCENNLINFSRQGLHASPNYKPCKTVVYEIG